MPSTRRRPTGNLTSLSMAASSPARTRPRQDRWQKSCWLPSNGLPPQTDAFRTDDEGIRKYFAAGLPPDEQTVVAATQGPFHVRATTAPVSHAAWREKPTFMVVAARVRLSRHSCKSIRQRWPRPRRSRVPSGDVAMLAHPKEVADLIIKAAE